MAYTPPMNPTDFSDLKKSIRQAGRIRRGERKPSRRFVIDEPDVADIRHKYDMSPNEVGRHK